MNPPSNYRIWNKVFCEYLIPSKNQQFFISSDLNLLCFEKDELIYSNSPDEYKMEKKLGLVDFYLRHLYVGDIIQILDIVPFIEDNTNDQKKTDMLWPSNTLKMQSYGMYFKRKFSDDSTAIAIRKNIMVIDDKTAFAIETGKTKLESEKFEIIGNINQCDILLNEDGAAK